MTVTVLKPGILASVQDQGRHGHRELGICPGGALDALGLAMANRLVGNDEGEAGLELTLGNCELRFDTDTRIALAGDDFGARLDGRPVWPLWSVPVRAGQRLRLGGANEWQPKAGLRTWLAVAGGIDVPPVLGSRSTDLKAGFGGWHGRALKKGDVLPLGGSRLVEAERARRPFGVHGGLQWKAEDSPADVITLRATPGPERGQFSQAMRRQFHSTLWRVTPQSNRMGSRLEGPAVARQREEDMLSSAVIPGTVQVPPSGQPIVLMGDAQTTGGYPRIAVVIRADMWKLAQAPLGGRLRLQEVDQAEALAAWAVLKRQLSSVNQGLAAMGWPGGA